MRLSAHGPISPRRMLLDPWGPVILSVCVIA